MFLNASEAAFETAKMGQALGRLNTLRARVGMPKKTEAELTLDLIKNEVISNKIAKDVFEAMFLSGKSAETIVEEKGLKQISSSDELESIIDKIIQGNESQKKQFNEGNTKVLGWFVGQVMKETKGQANPSIVNKVIIKKLKG